MNDIPKQLLLDSFEILLDKPISQFDNTLKYELYHWDDILNFELLEYFEIDEILKADGNNQVNNSTFYDTKESSLSHDRYSFDFGKSLFVFDKEQFDDLEVNFSSIKNELLKTDTGLIIPGHKIFPIIKEQNLEIEDLDYPNILFYVKTDGSLFDAMCAATWTMGGYEGLIEFENNLKAESEWKNKLSKIQNKKLVEHLSMLCLTSHYARGDGAYYSNKDCPVEFEELVKLNYELVTSWQFGEGQGSTGIFQVNNK